MKSYQDDRIDPQFVQEFPSAGRGVDDVEVIEEVLVGVGVQQIDEQGRVATQAPLQVTGSFKVVERPLPDRFVLHGPDQALGAQFGYPGFQEPLELREE